MGLLQGGQSALRPSQELSSLLLDKAAERYKMTPREREAVGYLIDGLTSKEIGNAMGISANTVKTFLRMAMMRMDVTTRSGILGKLMNGHGKAGLSLSQHMKT